MYVTAGHSKGAVNGGGELVKHYTTPHNLQKPEEAPENANDFVEQVYHYTDASKKEKL